ncbi:RNA polymerase sigma-70 factor, ECF subfamily [Blastococcus sp. DSM 46786]|uniref:RNA polymerase sigma factor n=1 Tax=Blastococcus sp. DSM 46786 TaxID=1798227 RepID=UPI0008CC9499|nr:RNA polymerase sigma factor [Blastococcus sp. DSM 46786]SEK41765.1 RNA polymerase sigma-70 factor, ECF subfamily [Blastococcus sp. DSM 46786]
MASDGSSRLEDAFLAAQAGRPWALRAVYEELAPRVHGYLRSRGAAEPDDLTSEVFLTVYSKLATVTGGASGLRTLAFSVAHARLVDDLRRQAVRGAGVPYEDWQDRRTSASSEDEAVERISTEEVRALLAVLPDDQRDVLLLRVVGDLSVEQAAQAMGRSTGAVKQLQRRGLLTLRARLQDSGAVHAMTPGIL